MLLEEELKNFGVSQAFIKIAMKYQSDYVEGSDIEAFVDLVEEKHALVEEAEYQEALAKEAAKANEVVDMSQIFGEEADEDEVLEDY